MTEQELLENYQHLDLIKLPDFFPKSGYEYHLIERTERKFLYAQLDAKTKKHYAYEVFKNKIIDNHRFAKHFYVKRNIPFVPKDHPQYKEIFPNNEAFGKYAWSYPRLDLARQKYDSIN